jgi:hypothetical protein
MRRGSDLAVAALVLLAAAGAACAACAACGERRVQPPRGASITPGLVELETVACEAGGVTAHWRGHTPEDGEPAAYATEAIVFSFASDGKERLFDPAGTLVGSDIRFDVFSPDCKHVLLLQDRFGPYHLVATARLADYLDGKGPPDKAFDSGYETSALVHHSAAWLSNDELEFRAGGETDMVLRYRVGDPAPRHVGMAPRRGH